jgi:hypothetical protein
MHCDLCGIAIDNGEENRHNRQILCEDCYMDALSPTKICDPWAVHHAKSCSESEARLNALQQKIIVVLEETGGLEMEPLAEKVGLTTKELERNLATLRHMEKIKARPEDGKKVFCLW